MNDFRLYEWSPKALIPYCDHCIKCRSVQRPKVFFVPGPHVFVYRDFLRWICVECGYNWYTETGDYKPYGVQKAGAL